MTLTPCAWIPAEYDGAGGSTAVPTIHLYAGGYTVRVFMMRLSTGSTWDDEPQPSSRTEHWIDRHTFPSLEAAGAALAAAPADWRPYAEDATERARQHEKERRS